MCLANSMLIFILRAPVKLLQTVDEHDPLLKAVRREGCDICDIEVNLDCR